MKLIWLFVLVVIFNACSVEEGSGSMELTSSESSIQGSNSSLNNSIDDSSSVGSIVSSAESTSNTQIDTTVVNIDDETQSDAPPTIPDSLSGLGS